MTGSHANYVPLTHYELPTDNGTERKPTCDVSESWRTLNMAIWTHLVKVSDKAKDRDEWRELGIGYHFTGKVRVRDGWSHREDEVSRVPGKS